MITCLNTIYTYLAAISSSASAGVFLGTQIPICLKMPHPKSYTVPMSSIISEFC